VTGAPIDLRSDTVTRPTAGMRRAMAEAEVGDDCFGEDPTVQALEAAAAEAAGREAALFVPSGTMANQIAIGLQVRPGDEVVLDAAAHILMYELGGVSATWGATPRPLATATGVPSPEQLGAVLAGAEVEDGARVALIAVENTHMHHGGIAHPRAALEPVLDLARGRAIPVHMDGARLFNAAAALGVSAAALTPGFATVSFCFSKGLGAPVGSCLTGSIETIREARRLRKRLGGGMRQAGIIAAGALYALRHHVARLGEDHARARRLADAIVATDGLAVAPHPPPSNIVMLRLAGAPGSLEAHERFRRRLESEGVLAFAEGPAVRLVTHLGIGDADIDAAIHAIRRAAPA
jgi:threonine aldolase